MPRCGDPSSCRSAPSPSSESRRPAAPLAAAPDQVATGTYVVLLHNGSSDEVQEAVLASIGSPDTVYRYTSAVEGFAADLRPSRSNSCRRTRRS